VHDSVYLISVLAVSILAFVGAILLPSRRYLAFLVGAILVTIIGIFSGRLQESDIWVSINVPVLTLIIALEIFAEALVLTGLPDGVIKALPKVSKDPLKIQILLVVLTYGLSLVINNLAAIIVMIPLTIRISDYFSFEMKKFLPMLVIVSNLGGASTAIGDFPNILISQKTHIDFLDFLLYLGLPIVFFFLPASYFACYSYRKRLRLKSVDEQYLTLLRLAQKTKSGEPAKLRTGAAILWFLLFIGMIISFMIFKGNEALIAIFFCSAILLANKSSDNIVKRVNIGVLVLFASLFVIVGGLISTGLFESLSTWLLDYSKDPIILSLALMWIACLVTALFSAGPTTASLLPLTIALGQMIPGNIEWWSLSLGVLAGSSGTLIGATAGPVATSLYENHTGERFSFVDFGKISLPAMILYVFIGSIYVTILVNFQGTG